MGFDEKDIIIDAILDSKNDIDLFDA